MSRHFHTESPRSAAETPSRSDTSRAGRPRRLALSAALALLVGLVVSAAARAGAAAPLVLDDSHREARAEGVTNELCPVLTDERVDPEIHTEFLGRTVYLCCGKCLKRFQADPYAYSANLPPIPSSLFEDVQRADPVQGPEAEAQDGHPHEPSEPAAAGPEQHDHAAHGGETSHGLLARIQWLGRLHPMVVHFPIALLLLAGLAEGLALRTASTRFAFAARFALWAGTAGALVAAPLGWADALAVAESYSGFPAKLLLYHRWAGTSTAVVALLTLAFCERFHRKGGAVSMRLYRTGLLLAVILVSLSGHLGAALIHGWDYLSR